MRSICLRIPAARRVLDFGCGSGWVVAEAEYESACQVFGIDCSLQALSSAKKRHIRLAAADGVQLPFADEAFDVVVGHVSMPYMNTRKALSEVFRVLAPGGSFFLTFHSFYYWRERLRSSVKARNWKDILFMGYVAANGFLNHHGLSQAQLWWRPSWFETVNTPRGVFRSARLAGFDMITTEDGTRRIFFAATGRKPNPSGGVVLPAPEWSIYCGLARRLQPAARARSQSA
ncbi:MAG: class I SAM-dependent methyltransferase [Acidobacteriaceae bacterium]|nr:class I SAM-dependent methyltransferase [Acidobacteriaceae bacterium]